MEHQRVWRGVDGDLFRFTTTDGRELYMALMSAFEISTVTAPALDVDQVRWALTGAGWDEPGDDVALQRTLAQLTSWGLLEVTQNHAASYASPEDFERRNLQWSLTRRGEAAISGVLHTFGELRSAVGLQPAVLDAIGDRLGDLALVLEGPEQDDQSARVHLMLAEVENHLSSLVASVRQFICSSGRPSIAVVALLRQLGALGAVLHQHADFDVAGLSITAWLTRRAGTTPWLMTADAYRAAIAVPRDRPDLGRVMQATPWDPSLADVMQHHGRAVYEEELTDHLLAGMHHVGGWCRSYHRPGIEVSPGS